MNPGPAPTLLNDWVTTDAFLALIGFAAFAVVIWMATEFLKRMHAASAQLDQVLQQGPPPFDDTCFIEVCTRPGLLPVHTVHGLRFVCRRHSGQVGDWTGDVYDQDLDPATDLSRWDKEMDAS